MKRTGKIWMGFLLSAGIILLSHCSPSGKSLLTFFFDGVPEQDSTMVDHREAGEIPVDSAGFQQEALGPTVFVHYPYQERECAACHDQNSLGSMIEPQPGLCYTCHEDMSTSYPYLHGPVAGGYCTSCHDPHSSEKKKLLKYSGDELCFHCHQSESVFKNEMHEGLEGMICMDCHNPHGGEDRYIFL